MSEQLATKTGGREQAGLDAHLVGVAREQYRSLMKAHQETASSLMQSGLSIGEASDWLEYARMMVKWYLEQAYGAQVAQEAVRQDVALLSEQLARQNQASQLALSRMLQSTASSLGNRLDGQKLGNWTATAETAGRQSLDSVYRSAVARLREAV